MCKRSRFDSVLFIVNVILRNICKYLTYMKWLDAGWCASLWSVCCLIDRLNCASSNRLAVWPEGGAEHEGCGRGSERRGASSVDGGGVQQERARESVHLRRESHLALLGPHGRALLPRRVGTNQPDREKKLQTGQCVPMWNIIIITIREENI